MPRAKKTKYFKKVFSASGITDYFIRHPEIE